MSKNKYAAKREFYKSIQDLAEHPVAQTGERFHGLKHPEKAYRNAKKYFPLNQIEVDIIRTHMWPVTFRTFPRTREGWVTTLTDKYCSLLETGRRK